MGSHLTHFLASDKEVGHRTPRLPQRGWGVRVETGDLSTRCGVGGGALPHFHLAPELQLRERQEKYSLGGRFKGTILYLFLSKRNVGCNPQKKGKTRSIGALMARGRSQWRLGRLKMEPRGVCVKKWLQNRITLYRSRIRICIKVISRIRIRIKVISRDPDPHQSDK